MTPHQQPTHRPMRLLAALLATSAVFMPAIFLPDAHAALIEQLLAVVNGKTIALSDLRRYQFLFASDVPPGQALQQMIDQQLLMVEAVRFDIELPDAARVREALQRLEQAAGGRAAWEAALEREQLTPSDAEQLMIEHLRTDSLLAQRVDQFVIVTRTEVEAAYEEQAERFQGKPLAEVEGDIERELVKQKVTAKRQDYLGRLRARATITVLAETPGVLPSNP